MKIQLSKSHLKAATQNWNTLANSKNKNKNYCVPTSIAERNKFDKYAARLRIDFRGWILLENAITAFNEVVDRLYEAPELKSVVSYGTVYTALKKELEIEISTREKDAKNKKGFADALEGIQRSIDDEISHFDFFFAIEGLKLENLEKIGFGKAEIFVFNQELRDQLIAAHFETVDSQNPEASVSTQAFIDKNFLNRLCIRSTAYGEFDIARKKAYRQARELINYFRYVLCLFIHDRVSEQIIKINLSFEMYSNGERTLSRKDKDNTIILTLGPGRKPLKTFPIDKNRLENLLLNVFLDDFTTIINACSQTELEGCILTAIYWIGEAQNESDLDVSFLKYWTALECIFTGSEQPTHALAKGVSTLNAFSNYEFIRIEDTREVYTNMTKLYVKRSDIIHRGRNYLANRVINEVDISKICKYTAWSILSLFHLRSMGYSNMREVGDQINRSYAQWSFIPMNAKPQE